MSTNFTYLEHTPQGDTSRASLAIDASACAPHRVPPYLYGKFCEHLGSNIYNGMEAQILHNPTFGKWSFVSGTDLVNGGVLVDASLETVKWYANRSAERKGWVSPEAVMESYQSGLAFGWIRLGSKENVRFSPDTGPRNNRAQRVEVLRSDGNVPQGLAQDTYLPLHRTNGYEFTLLARAVDPVDIKISIASLDRRGMVGKTLAQVSISLGPKRQTYTGKLRIADDLPADGIYRVAITADGPAHLVIERLLLYPDDHIGGADPDVIRFLREAKLPLLRWPGGNFVSGYRWEDGIGPRDERPTVMNPAWDGLEYHLFGTAEFIAFCRAVGCEPMICINAGDGTPEEATRWVEYCNGRPETPMGKRRIDHGFPEPFGVKIWEIGNELWFSHQVGWTTAGGYVDRYLRYREAMLAVDPSLRIIAMGDQVTGAGGEWNERLVKETHGSAQCISDHILADVHVDQHTDPVELFHAYMGEASFLGGMYRGLEKSMLEAGIQQPRLAITELQMFSHFRGEVSSGAKMTPETMPSQATISEALYTTTIIHECIRLGEFSEMVTHSATVNHGAGLNKRQERVWADPCHYAHAMGIALAGGNPVKVRLACGTFSTKTEFRKSRLPAVNNIPVLDVVGVLEVGGQSLIVMLVHRCATCGPIALSIELGDFSAAPLADVLTLAGESMHDRNSLTEPARVVPRASILQVKGSKAELTLPAFSLTRLTFKAERRGT